MDRIVMGSDYCFAIVHLALGARVAHRTPGRALKRVFAVVLYRLATNMLVSSFT